MGNNQNQYQYHSNNPLGDLIVDAALIGVTAALKSHHQNKNHSNNGKNQSQNPQKYTNSQTKTPSLSKYNTENPSIKGPGNESQALNGNAALSKDQTTFSLISMKTLYVFDAKSKEIICSHTLNGQIISIDSNFVAVRNTKHITFFDRQDDWSVEVKDRDFDTCIAAFLHPNKKEFICLNTTGSFSRWYIEYNSRLYSYEMVTKPLSMIPSPDFKFAAILSEGKIELLNLEESNATPFQIENRTWRLKFIDNSQFLLAISETSVIAIDVNEGKEQTFAVSDTSFRIQDIASFHNCSKILVYGKLRDNSESNFIPKESTRIYLWNLENGESSLLREEADTHFNQVCVSNFDLFLATKNSNFFEVTSLSGEKIFKIFPSYKEYDVYFGKDDSRLLIFSGDEVLENISFEKKLIGNSPIVSIKATNILGNETVLKIPSGLYVWHAKKKLAEEYKKDINKIQLLMNSEVLHDYQKISSISLNNEIQVQVIFTQNS